MNKGQEQKISPIHQLMDSLTNKLTSTIVALQSDQVIEQMRNDKSLYQYKLTHIKEIIEEHFSFQKQITHLISQNQHLKQSLNLTEHKIAKKDQEFREVIDMIEESAKQHTKNNQNQINRLKGTIKQLQSKLINKSDVTEKINKKTNQLSFVINDLESEKQRLKKEIGKLREENGKLIQTNKKQKMNKKEVENENEKLIQNLKQQHQKEIQEYQIIVKKMQNDMLIIKTQWQKKCNQVQKNLRQFYETQFLKLEEKKSRELIEHIQTMKEGKPVIIKQDQDILTTRIESVRRQYDVQIERIQKHNREIEEMYQTLQSVHGAKVKQIEGLGDALKAVRNEFEDEKQNWMSQKQKSKRQIEKLKAIVLEFERNNKDTVLSSQAKSSEILKLNDNIKFIEKKLQIANRTVNEQKNLISANEDQIEELKNKCMIMEENYKKSKKSFQNLQNQIEGKNKKIQNLSREADKLNEKVSDLLQKQQGLKVQIKNLKANKLKYRKLADKMFMQIKQCQKQLILIREDVKYMQQLQKKKNLSDFDKFVDHIERFNENIQRQSKNRMNQLICQIQQAKQAEHTQFQIVLRQRQNLKREVSELEDLFQRKQRQVEEAKKNILNAQTEEVKRTMIQEVQRERLKYQRLEQQIINNQKEYHRRLEKVRGQVKDAVRVLTNKWMEEIIRVEEDNKRKDIELQRIMDKVQMVISDNQQSKDKYENEKEEAKRFRKKYETLKQQKDEQINDLIKRLQRESKHKIALQKQLRTIRSELNKGEKYSKQYFEHENKSGNNFQVTDREKQISEIRELIARTYQVVGQKPEKDTKLERKKGLL